jgi:hypothetical protein
MEFYATIGTVTAGPSASIYIANFDNAKIGSATEGDGVVDLIDFGEFAQDFLAGTNPRSDYNCDSVVDLIDFGEFAQHFGHDCTTPSF